MSDNDLDLWMIQNKSTGQFIAKDFENSIYDMTVYKIVPLRGMSFSSKKSAEKFLTYCRKTQDVSNWKIVLVRHHLEILKEESISDYSQLLISINKKYREEATSGLIPNYQGDLEIASFEKFIEDIYKNGNLPNLAAIMRLRECYTSTYNHSYTTYTRILGNTKKWDQVQKELKSNGIKPRSIKRKLPFVAFFDEDDAAIARIILGDEVAKIWFITDFIEDENSSLLSET